MTAKKNKSILLKEWNDVEFLLYISDEAGSKTKTHLHYQYYNPLKNKIDRVKIAKGLTSQKLAQAKVLSNALKLVDEIIEQLKAGWNPFTGQIAETATLTTKSTISECM